LDRVFGGFGMKRRTLVLLFLGLPSLAWADTIRLKNGGSLEGVILKTNADGVVVMLKYATVTLNSTEIESIDREAASPATASGRLADWIRCFHAVAARPWGEDLHALPAPVLDQGALKNVPYFVHLSDEHQIALYGDPEAPALIELGLSGGLQKSDTVRKEMIELLAGLLTDPKDAETLRGLSSGGGKKEREGLEFEIYADADSRGVETWWVSVSDPRALDAARVSGKQLETISAPEIPVAPRNPTLVQPGTRKGEPQEVITPFGTEPHPSRHRRSGGGGGGRRWNGPIHWNHGHVTMPPAGSHP
jgi:hypothetical protein